ncbi:MAG TPA: prephenate dehydratase domain-containing protein, partial [Pyrinomonadaceae bacterium]|nr:prephenate dehydratase domain-containing protein [Pyrinomonadaceae bacterium]
MTRVAIQGIDGSYSSEAAGQLVHDATLVECRDFEETFSAVRNGRADCAVVPVSNRILGEIRMTRALLDDSDLDVKDRMDLKVEHVLVGTGASTFADLVSVRSHVEALKQCSRFLGEHNSLARVVGSDTATS